jgi:hypothetical protein
MQLKTIYTQKHTLLTGSLLAAMLLAGCDQPSASASTSALSSSAAGRGYEVVLETRPERPDAFVGRQKGLYNFCVTTAKNLQSPVPVKPFTRLPANFFTERETLISDGKSFYKKSEGVVLDPGMTVENGCASALISSSTSNILRDHKNQVIAVADDGSIDVSPPEAQLEMPAKKSDGVSGYSVRKTVNGIALRCLPKDHPIIRSQLALDSCIYDDGAGGTLTDEVGQSILIYGRIPSPEKDPGFGSVLVIEPKSVKLGKPRDAKVFNWVESK